MSPGPNVGIAAAVAELEGAETGAPTNDRDQEQRDLLTGPPASDEPNLFDISDAAEGPVTQAIEQRRGPGRPKGSPNKKTDDLRRYLLGRGDLKHPVLAAAEIYSMSVDDLRAALPETSAKDAVLIQIRCMEFVAPYVEAKMPQKLVIDGNERLPEFHLHFGQQGAELRDEQGNKVDLVALAARAKDAMSQRLIEGEAIRSHDDGSQEPDKALTYQDDNAT